MSLSFLSVNARGLKDNVKRKALFLYAKNYKTSFCFFQESHSSKEDTNFWRTQWGSDLWLAHGSSHSAGVAILKNDFTGNVVDTENDPLGHFCFLIISFEGNTIIAINIYGYNSSTENDILLDVVEDKLVLYMDKYPEASLIIGGDFNITQNDTLDRWPPRQSNSNSKLKAFMDRYDIIDIWRGKNPQSCTYTWSKMLPDSPGWTTGSYQGL